MSPIKNAIILYNNDYFNHILNSTLAKHPNLKSDYEDLLEEITNGKFKINQVIISLFSKLTEVNPHFMFKRYSGSGNIPALFDTLEKNNIQGYFISLEAFIKDYKDSNEDFSFIIPPLEMTYSKELYTKAKTLKKPVFPRSFRKWESKIITKIVFQKISISTIFVPNAKDLTPEMVGKLKKVIKSAFSSISTHIIIKDNEGFHSGAAFAYYFGSIDNFESLITHFLSKTISIVIEPLVYQIDESSNTPFTKIIKIHSFNGLLESEILAYDVEWLKLNGKFGPGAIKLVKTEVWNKFPKNLPIYEINQIIRKSFPFNMLSLDFVYHKTLNQWLCIDINHACGSWGEAQENGGNINYTIFDLMITSILNIKYEEFDSTVEKIEANIPAEPDSTFIIKPDSTKKINFIHLN